MGLRTQVVFRKFDKLEGNEVIAIFYALPGTYNPYTCQSYMHMGQHGSCDPMLITQTCKLAKPEEYADLKAELESLGYDLDIRKRIPYCAIEMRRTAINAYKDVALKSCAMPTT